MKLKHNEIKREDLQIIIDFPIILYIVTEYSLSKKLRSCVLKEEIVFI
jgi:hypothetical protein